MGLFVSTVSADVSLPKLGIVLVHPTTNYDLGSQFSGDDLKRASDLTAAITGGTLTWKRTAGGSTEAAGDYDPDFLDIDNESAGGQVLYRAPKFLDLHYHRAETTATTASGIKTLTKISPSIQFFTGSAGGYSVVLPDATTETIGRFFEFFNMSSQNITIKTSGGATLFTLSQTSVGYVRLQLQADAAGSWVAWQVFISSLASGILNYTVISSTPFSTSVRNPTFAAITGFSVTPQAGTYAVWFNASTYYTTTPKGHWWQLTKGGVAVADSLRRQDTAHSNQTMVDSTMAIVTFDGSEACGVKVSCDNTGTLTVNDRTLLLVRLGG